jgi:hypothetical protein
VGLYYKDLTTAGAETLTLEATSNKMNQYRWEGGYRITESEEEHIYMGGMLTATPTVFVVETATMKIVAAEPPESINVVNIVKELNSK